MTPCKTLTSLGVGGGGNYKFTCCGRATSLVASWVAMVTAWVALGWCSEAMTSHFNRTCMRMVSQLQLSSLHPHVVRCMKYPGEPLAKLPSALLGEFGVKNHMPATAEYTD